MRVGMEKQLNGIFREWMRVLQADESAPPVIWGHCVVHLSHPEFSGKVLHTSGVLSIAPHASFLVAETRNHYYALLGPELVMPADREIDPMTYVTQQRGEPRRTDAWASAAMNADRDCAHCGGTGLYRYDERHVAICDRCCRHTQGWWQLEGAYGPDNGRWACKAGCGTIVDAPPLELNFLPRALA
jgi:hypothetical protein